MCISRINRYYNSVQNLLFFCLKSRKLKIEIYKTVMLPVVLYGCETWALTFREEHRLRVEGMKTDREENCIMMNFKTCIPHPILLG